MKGSNYWMDQKVRLSFTENLNERCWPTQYLYEALWWNLEVLKWQEESCFKHKQTGAMLHRAVLTNYH